jgi:putative ABC transport system permease protein
MLRTILSEAWRSLTADAQRSLLTMLGIAWGITTLVMLYSYGSGIHRMVSWGLEIFGTNLIEIWGGRTTLQAGGVRAGRRIRLHIEDLDFLLATVPGLRAASPEMFNTLQVVSATRRQEFDVLAVYPSFGTMRRMTVEEGRWINAADEAQRGRVVVLGSNVRARLFGEQPAIGESVRMNGISFEVVGVLQKKVGGFGRNDNRLVFLPFSADGLLESSEFTNAILVQAEKGFPRPEIVKQIRTRLGERLGFQAIDKGAINVWDSGAEMDRASVVTGIVQSLVGVIGAITLAIGGIGVMNIMLVAVTQRTREIGLLKAIGARRRHILGQFLAEALMITLLGGLLGLAFSAFLCWMIPPLPLWSAVSGDNGKEGDLILSVDWNTLFLATGLLGAVGLIAGIWPAVRASRLDPVEALRYE